MIPVQALVKPQGSQGPPTVLMGGVLFVQGREGGLHRLRQGPGGARAAAAPSRMHGDGALRGNRLRHPERVARLWAHGSKGRHARSGRTLPASAASPPAWRRCTLTLLPDLSQVGAVVARTPWTVILAEPEHTPTSCAGVFCQPGIASAVQRALWQEKGRPHTDTQALALAERIWCAFLEQLVGCRKTVFSGRCYRVECVRAP